MIDRLLFLFMRLFDLLLSFGERKRLAQIPDRQDFLSFITVPP